MLQQKNLPDPWYKKAKRKLDNFDRDYRSANIKLSKSVYDWFLRLEMRDLYNQ